MNKRFVARRAGIRRLGVGVLASGLAATAASACDLVVPDYNNPSVEDLQNNPNRAAVAAAAQGLLFDTRITAADMVMWVGAFGREVYPMAPTGSALPGSVRDPWDGTLWVGTQVWGEAYQNIRNANLLLEALGASELPAGETAAVRGFAKTIQAYEFLHVAVTRRRLGAPVAVDSDPNADPAPIVSETELYDHVANLLDDARSDLAGADAFPFSVPGGLDDFNAPSSFLALNGRSRRAPRCSGTTGRQRSRRCRNRSSTRTARWTTAPTTTGPSTRGDMVNPANRPDLLWANTRFRGRGADAGRRLQGPALRDEVQGSAHLSASGGGFGPAVHAVREPGRPLRLDQERGARAAPSRGELGHGRPRPGHRGHQPGPHQLRGLEPLPESYAGSDADLLDELLYNKRFSLVFEWGHTWVDMNRYGKLMEIPVLGPPSADQRLHDAMPYPLSECLPREPDVPAGCTTQPGFVP